MRIIIKKHSQPGWLLWLIIVLPFLLGFFCELIGLPWAIRYVLDISWIMLLVLLCMQRTRKSAKGTSLPAFWVWFFFAYTLTLYLVQYQSAFYYLWGLRNNFRFFVVFFAFAAFLKPDDIRGYFKLFDTLFWVNVVVSLYQYFFMNLSGDHLGGLFSTEAGGNGYTNIYFIIVLTKDLLLYIEKKEPLATCVSKCLAALLIAAFAELKFFFVEFVLMIGLVVLFAKFSWRKLLVILGGIGAAVAFSALLVAIFPNFEGFFTLDWFMEVGGSDKGYTSAGDLNRLNAISRINELWLRTGWQRLFGLGLGNCDTATYAFLNTPFYEAYGDMHYTWLSYAHMYLECGWIGLIFYFGFFVLVYFSVLKIEKRSEGITKTYCRMSRILALMCMVIAIYNSSLRTEAGYMMYFALAVPFAMHRSYSGVTV